MKKKENRGQSHHVFLLAAVLIFAAGCLLVKTQLSHASDTKKSKMNPVANSSTELQVMPPIDETATPIVETASFGLG